MITLPRIHRFRFIKHHIRYFQGASVVFRAIESTSVARSFPEEKRSEDNSNNARIFASKETAKILRSILVLKLCSYDFVGRNSMAVDCNWPSNQKYVIQGWNSKDIMKTRKKNSRSRVSCAHVFWPKSPGENSV